MRRGYNLRHRIANHTRLNVLGNQIPSSPRDPIRLSSYTLNEHSPSNLGSRLSWEQQASWGQHLLHPTLAHLFFLFLIFKMHFNVLFLKKELKKIHQITPQTKVGWQNLGWGICSRVAFIHSQRMVGAAQGLSVSLLHSSAQATFVPPANGFPGFIISAFPQVICSTGRWTLTVRLISPHCVTASQKEKVRWGNTFRLYS